VAFSKTREQHALRNLGTLRLAIERGSALAYFDDRRLRGEAHRLAADAQHLGGRAFSEALHALAVAGTLATDERPWDGILVELEEELPALERECGTLWALLARRLRGAPAPA
jgi:hypothetical protein